MQTSSKSPRNLPTGVLRSPNEAVEKLVSGIPADAAAARELAARLKLNYPSMVGDIDAMDIARKLGNDAGVLPYTVLIGPDGKADTADLEDWLNAPPGGG